jgi:hypothetical protein
VRSHSPHAAADRVANVPFHGIDVEQGGNHPPLSLTRISEGLEKHVPRLCVRTIDQENAGDLSPLIQGRKLTARFHGKVLSELLLYSEPDQLVQQRITADDNDEPALFHRSALSPAETKYLMPRYAFEMPACIRRALPGRSKRIALQHPEGRVRCFILVVHHIAQEHAAGDG